MNHTVFDPVYDSGIPQLTFDVTGFPCYDPRDGTRDINTPSTWKYSANAAIINANYLIHELGAAFPTSRVNWTSVTLKNGGTEPRYSCAVRWTTDERRRHVASAVPHLRSQALVSASP